MRQLSQRLTKVSLVDPRPLHEEFWEATRAAIERVCQSQQFILGPQVVELEVRFASKMQCRHGIGVSSGTDALLLALMALEIGAGDEIITSPFAPIAAAAAIARAGARPIFCDIDPETYNLSPAEVDEFIDRHCEVRRGAVSHGRQLVNRKTGGKIKAVLPVHLFGQLCDMKGFMELARHLRLKVIEDAAEAVGAHDDSHVSAGSFGDVGCFSFCPTKALGALGDAGMCVTNDDTLAARMKILRTHGAKAKHHHTLIGGNFRLDEIQAAVLNVKLDFLDDWTRMRDFNAHLYTESLASKFSRGGVVPPQIWHVEQHAFSRYVIRAQNRDALRDHLETLGIGADIYCPIPLHLQPCFASLGYKAGDLPQAELAARESLALPMHPHLTAPQIEHVVAAVAAFYRH
jgi:dTDP-4-amino-4,6-dideoxygalactose transaminase